MWPKSSPSYKYCYQNGIENDTGEEDDGQDYFKDNGDNITTTIAAGHPWCDLILIFSIKTRNRNRKKVNHVPRVLSFLNSKQNLIQFLDFGTWSAAEMRPLLDTTIGSGSIIPNKFIWLFVV